MSQLQFVGRDFEKERLEAFFNDVEGGSILVAGKRGSGKTTLINEVLSSRPQHSLFYGKLARKTLNNSIQINIPLIIVAKSQANSENLDRAEIYRSLILRSVALALLNHLRKRQYDKFILPVWMFLGIGLVRRIKKLEKYVEYSHLERLTKVSLGLKAEKVDALSERTLNGVLDLSDTKLEMMLHDLFTLFAKQTKIVIVFDEMDKLDELVPLQEVVLYLKNLFSDTGVHAIFVASEKQGYEQLKSKESPDDNKFITLFKNIVIIKGVDPLGMKEFIFGRLKGDVSEKLNIYEGLAIATDNYPFRVNAILSQNNYELSRLAESLKEIIGDYAYSYHAASRVFVDLIYSDYRKKHNTDFNHLLYETLCETAKNIVDMKIKYINVNQLYSVLYPSDLFGDEDEENTFKQSGLSPESTYQPTSVPELVKTLDSTRYNFNPAIGSLITLLERTKWLELEMVPDANRLIGIKHFNGDTFTINNLDIDYAKAFELKKNERKIKSLAQKFIIPYRSISQKSSFWYDSLIPIVPFAGNYGEQATLVHTKSLGNTRLSWSLIEQKVDLAEDELLKALFERLNLGTSIQNLSISDNVASFSKDDTSAKLVFEFEDDKILNDNGVDKKIILRSPGVNSPKIRGNKVKYFNFESWEESNTKGVLDSLSSYISQL